MNCNNIYFIASSLTDSFGSSGGGGGGGPAINSRPHRQTSVPAPPVNTYINGATDGANLEVLEYPFLTMKTYPPGFIVHIGKSLLVLVRYKDRFVIEFVLQGAQ